MKNLDNPLNYDDFLEVEMWEEIAKYHGLPFTEDSNFWNCAFVLFNARLEDYDATNKEDKINYEKYLDWCKLAQSPLYKALNEVEE